MWLILRSAAARLQCLGGSTSSLNNSIIKVLIENEVDSMKFVISIFLASY
jgi:hypothetical protein